MRASAIFTCALLVGCGASSDDTTALGGAPGAPGGAAPTLPGQDTDGAVTPPLDDGTDGTGGPLAPGGGSADCEEEARWIYVVHSDQFGGNNQLLRFEPDALRFTPIGTLDCAGASNPNDPFAGLLGSSPFSMAVDRSATAWVLYNDGSLYHASTQNASCSATGFASNNFAFENFGMGFVSDEAGGSSETLFVASAGGNAQLATLDTNSLNIQPLGTMGGQPELTGTGNAQLWGFFPNDSPATVRQIDKTTGAAIQSFPLGFSTQPAAWAFAFWGGRFYVFIKGQTDASSAVWRLDPTTGASEAVMQNIGYDIVGAGVSTCAPVEII